MYLFTGPGQSFSLGPENSGHFNCEQSLMFCSVDVFCYLSICYALMNAPFFAFLQKKHNTPQNINKSFNLLIPLAKSNSHISLARKKTLYVNDIFYLTWRDDLWALVCLLCLTGVWCLICMEESELCCLIDQGSSPSLHRVMSWLETQCLHAVLFPANRQSFFLQVFRDIERDTHGVRLFDLTHIPVSTWTETDREGEYSAVCG